MADNLHRVEWIDAAKGFGMVLIMLSHVGGLTKDPYVNSLLMSGYVSMFFVLSGLTFKFKPDLRKQIKGKAFRLLIPYFFYATIITLLTDILFKGVKIPHLVGVLYSRYKIFVEGGHSDYGLSIGCPPVWFLTSLFVAYLLVYLWQKCEHHRNLLIFVYLFLSIGMNCLPILLPWSIDMAHIGALLIISGIKQGMAFYRKQSIGMFVVFVLIYSLLVYINGHTNMSIRYYGDIPLISIVLFYLLARIECWIICMVFCWVEEKRWIKIFEKLFVYIGRQSLRLMCIHVFIWMKLIHKIPFHSNSLKLTIIIVVIFAVNHLIYMLCERYKGNVALLKYL